MFRRSSPLGLAALFCVSGAYSARPAVVRPPLEQSWDPCETCEWGVRSVQDYVANTSHQEALEETLDSVICAHLPTSERPTCERRIQSAVRQAVRAFEDYVNPQTICHPVCPGAPAPSATVGSWQCPFCEFLAVQAERALQNETTDKEVLHFIEQQCADLPPSFQAQCEQYVHTDGPELIHLLETTPANEVCAEAGACEPPNGLVAAVRATPPPDELNDALIEVMQSIGRVRLAQTCAAPGSELGVGENQECEFCRVAITEARAKIADPQFQSEAEKFMEKLCNQTGDYKETCVDSIQEYAPLAFSLALDYVRPTLVCVDLVHVCPKKPELTLGA